MYQTTISWMPCLLLSYTTYWDIPFYSLWNNRTNTKKHVIYLHKRSNSNFDPFFESNLVVLFVFFPHHTNTLSQSTQSFFFCSSCAPLQEKRDNLWMLANKFLLASIFINMFSMLFICLFSIVCFFPVRFHSSASSAFTLRFSAFEIVHHSWITRTENKICDSFECFAFIHFDLCGKYIFD